MSSIVAHSGQSGRNAPGIEPAEFDAAWDHAVDQVLHGLRATGLPLTTSIRISAFRRRWLRYGLGYIGAQWLEHRRLLSSEFLVRTDATGYLTIRYAMRTEVLG